MKADGYDAMGNETSVTIGGGTYRYTYDDEDRMTSLTTPSGTDTFTYNGLGLRVTKTDSTGSYAYLCDGTSPGSPVLTDGAALYTPGLSENRGGASRYYANDQRGNLWTIDASSKGQLDYQDTTGFGTLVAQAGSGSVFGYGGGNGCQTDADTGLILMGHRYYDTRIGRFITQDPAGAGDNWYAYAGNSPTNAIDPLGLDQCPPGCNQQSWDQDADERNENFAEQEDYLSDQFPDATMQHDEYGFPFVQDGSATVYAVSDGTSSADDGGMQAADDLLTGGMDTKAVESARSGNWGAAGAYFAAGTAMVYMTMRGGGGAARAEEYLTADLIKSARPIVPVKQAENLALKYGGKARNWQKFSTEVIQHPDTGEPVEIHWFQNWKDNIGRIKIKWKFDPFE